MALNDYSPPRQTVEYKNKPLVSVRGLNVEDVSTLIRGYLADLKMIFDSLDGTSARKLLLEPEQLDRLLFSLVTKVPNTAAKMIAMASDEPDNVEGALRLSAPLQIKILMEVVRLTFEDVGGPLAFAAMLKQVAEAAAPGQTIQ